MTSFTSDATAAGGLTVTGLTSASQALGVANASAAATTTFTFSAGLGGTADNVTLNLSNLSAAQTIDITDGAAANSIETLTINGTGSNTNAAGDTVANVLANDALAATTIVIGGSGFVDITGAAVTGATSVDASKNTGGSSVRINVAASNSTITGGSGNDTVRFNNGTFDANDVVRLGGGTDTLRLTVADATALTTKSTNISGVEILRLENQLTGVLTVGNFEATAGDVTQVRLDDGIAAGTVTGLTSGDTLRLGAAGTTGTVTVTGATTAGTNDTVNITLSAATNGANIDFGTGAGLTIAGVENLNISSSRTAAPVAADINTLPFTAAAARTITVSGNTNTNLGTVGANVNSITSTISTANVATAGLTVTLANGAGSSAQVTTGAGNDVIVSVAGGDAISTGAGDDTITMGAGDDNINGGAGNDTVIIVDGSLTDTDVVAFGDGSADTLSINASTTIGDAAFTSVTGLEVMSGGTGATGAIALNLGTKAASAFTSQAVRVDQGAVAAQSFNISGTAMTSGTLEFRGAAATATTSDTIVGGAGADKIAGGVNSATTGDRLTGGSGADIFFWRSFAEATGGAIAGTETASTELDSVIDFVAGTDKLQFLTGVAMNGVTFAATSTATVTTLADSAASRADLDAVATAAATAFTEALSTNAAPQFYLFTNVNIAGVTGQSVLFLNDATTIALAASDIAMVIGVTGTLTGSDIVFGNLFA